MMAEVQKMATAVPKAAPATPMPAPGISNCQAPMESVRVGKMNNMLNTTSRMHISKLSKLGTRMFPLHRSMLPDR